MTRETKIGLLIGLGFIVVFAVLLSHTGIRPPAGDDLPMVLAERPPGPQGLPGGAFTPGAPSSIPRGGPGGGPVATGPDASSRGPSGPGGVSHAPLPRPDLLNPSPGQRSELRVDDRVATTGLPGSGRDATTVVEIQHRVAPAPGQPIPAPQPTARPPAPEASPPPEAAPTAPPVRPGSENTYTVQAGDTLGDIAKRFYDTASVRVVDYLVQANKDRIKNKNLVVAGTDLTIPDLPPDLFEQVKGFNLSGVGPNARTVGAEFMDRASGPRPDDGTRRAPEPSNRTMAANGSSDGSPDGGAEAFRSYEIRPNDTLSDIAREELGSATRWRSILELNPRIEPTKLRPGTTIRLPKKRPVSDASGSRRVQA